MAFLHLALILPPALGTWRGRLGPRGRLQLCGTIPLGEARLGVVIVLGALGIRKLLAIGGSKPCNFAALVPFVKSFVGSPLQLATCHRPRACHSGGISKCHGGGGGGGTP